MTHAVSYIRQAAQGLQHGMQKSLVHRDIKPGNLMLTEAGAVKVADFGLAKFSRESDKARDRSLTGLNAMMGTPDYMAPEQARNAKAADIRADIYSLGCTFYYLLAGRPPFAGASIADLIVKHWHDARPDVGSLREDVPAELSLFIQKMMATEPADRPRTPKEVIDSLAPFAKVVAVKREAAAQPPREVFDFQGQLSQGESAGKQANGPATKAAAVVAPEKADDAFTFQAPKPEPATREMDLDQWRGRRQKKRTLVAVVAGCLLATLALLAAVRLFTGTTADGAIVLETVPVDAEVLVDGRAVTVARDGKTFEVRVAPDKKHHLEVKRAGFRSFESDVAVAAGGRQTVAVRLRTDQDRCFGEPCQGGAQTGNDRCPGANA